MSKVFASMSVKNPWANYELFQDGASVVHTIPLDDLEPHRAIGYACTCWPRVIPYQRGVNVVHNAWDGREWLETVKVVFN